MNWKQKILVLKSTVYGTNKDEHYVVMVGLKTY